MNEATHVRRLSPGFREHFLHAGPVEEQYAPQSVEVGLAGCDVSIRKQAPGCRGQALTKKVHDTRVRDHCAGASILGGGRTLDEPEERRTRIAVQEIAQRRRGLPNRESS